MRNEGGGWRRCYEGEVWVEGDGGGVRKEGLRRGIRDERIDRIDRKEKGRGRIIREEG